MDKDVYPVMVSFIHYILHKVDTISFNKDSLGLAFGKQPKQVSGYCTPLNFASFQVVQVNLAAISSS